MTREHTDREHENELRTPRGVLFVCVANAARSQMAEGLARRRLPRSVRVWSAGSQPGDAVHPRAVQVMREIGVDISGQRPKGFADVPMGDVDTVVTLCAEESCPVVPGQDLRRESWPLPDPAAAGGSDEERLDAFRKIRDQLRARIEALDPAQPHQTPGSSR